jgi:PAS domain S-box-containing protein
MVEKKEITARIKDLLTENPQGLSITEIVQGIKVNRNTAGRYLETLTVSGQVEMRRFGMSKIFRLAQRVPLSAMLSISSELIMLLDGGLRVVYANEPVFQFMGTTQKDLCGKNIEFTRCATVFDDDTFDILKKHMKAGLGGTEWSGELSLKDTGIIFSCRIAPTVFEGGQRGVSVLLEDITGRKQSEMALRESEDRYRTLVEISPDAVILHRDGKIIYLNPAAQNLLGATDPNEIIGTNVIDYVQPGFRDAVRINIKKDLGGDITPAMELHMVRLDGTPIIVEGRGVKTFFGGKPAIQVAIRDITEFKRAEKELRESETTLRSLINAPTDSVLLVDSKDIILDLNETAARRFGKRKEELIGIPADSIVPEELAKARRSIIRQVLEKRDAVRFEDERAGIWFDTVAYPVLSESGEVNKIAIISRDITDRRHVEERLGRSEQRFRNLVTTTPDIIWETDEQSRFIYISPQVERILGYKPEELIGHAPFEYFHPDAREPNRLTFQKARERDEKYILHETRWIHKDGHSVLLESHATPTYHSDGSFAGFLGIDRERQ